MLFRSGSLPREEKPAPFPETVVRSSIGGGGGVSNDVINSRGEGGVKTFPLNPNPPVNINKAGLLPGDVIQKVQMNVGAEVFAPPAPDNSIRDNGALVGRGSTLLSASSQDAATNNNQFQSKPRSLNRSIQQIYEDFNWTMEIKRSSGFRRIFTVAFDRLF